MPAPEDNTAKNGYFRVQLLTHCFFKLHEILSNFTERLTNVNICYIMLFRKITKAG